MKNLYLKKIFTGLLFASQFLLLSASLGYSEPALAGSLCSSSTKGQIRYHARQVVINKLGYLAPRNFRSGIEYCNYSASIDVAKGNVRIAWWHPSEQIYYSGRLQIIQSEQGISYRLLSNDRNLQGHIRNMGVLAQPVGYYRFN